MQDPEWPLCPPTPSLSRSLAHHLSLITLPLFLSHLLPDACWDQTVVSDLGYLRRNFKLHSNPALSLSLNQDHFTHVTQWNSLTYLLAQQWDGRTLCDTGMVNFHHQKCAHLNWGLGIFHSNVFMLLYYKTTRRNPNSWTLTSQWCSMLFPHASFIYCWVSRFFNQLNIYRTKMSVDFLVDVLTTIYNMWTGGLWLTMAVRFSSVMGLSVSTTEMYPRRQAMDRAVFPFWPVTEQQEVSPPWQTKSIQNFMCVCVSWCTDYSQLVGRGSVLKQQVDDVGVALLSGLV